MCFSMDWLMHLAIWVVVAVATWIILIQILMPYLMRKLAPGGQVGEGISLLMQVLRVILWAVVIIIVIYVVFALLSCLWSMAGGVSLFPRGR